MKVQTIRSVHRDLLRRETGVEVVCQGERLSFEESFWLVQGALKERAADLEAIDFLNQRRPWNEKFIFSVTHSPGEEESLRGALLAWLAWCGQPNYGNSFHHTPMTDPRRKPQIDALLEILEEGQGFRVRLLRGILDTLLRVGFITPEGSLQYRYGEPENADQYFPIEGVYARPAVYLMADGSDFFARPNVSSYVESVSLLVNHEEAWAGLPKNNLFGPGEEVNPDSPIGRIWQKLKEESNLFVPPRGSEVLGVCERLRRTEQFLEVTRHTFFVPDASEQALVQALDELKGGATPQPYIKEKREQFRLPGIRCGVSLPAPSWVYAFDDEQEASHENVHEGPFKTLAAAREAFEEYKKETEEALKMAQRDIFVP